MCLILIASHLHPGYPLIIAANRDEFYHRPTAPLAFWDDHPEILAGKDLTGTGTWLGVSKTGRIAAVTNYRDPTNDRTNSLSRGVLVSHFLMGSQSPGIYIDRIQVSGDLYNGFNLIVGNINELWWFSNINRTSLKLDPGMHGISNHLLDTPWPKLEKAKMLFHDMILHERELNPENIFNMLSDTAYPPEEQLPDTGIGPDWERVLSPIFVSSEAYGTRSSSIILCHHNGLLSFFERTFQTPSPLPTPLETRQVNIWMKPDVRDRSSG
jgi:uncharacterized protein with NRDE domain